MADEKKSGTSNPVPVSASARYHAQDDPTCPVTAFASKLSLPKRKTLTATQIDNVEKSAVAQDEAHKVSDIQGLGTGRVVQGGFALPGLTTRPNSNTGAKRAPSISSKQSDTQSPSPISAASDASSDLGFRRPSIPASASRTPSINSLARPVHPGAPQNVLANRTMTKSTSLPVPTSTPRLRAPSPGLLQRMPSFEKNQKQDDGPCPVRKMFTPKKLNLKKQSVDDLRRLYEERAGTASALVEAGRVRYA